MSDFKGWTRIEGNKTDDRIRWPFVKPVFGLWWQVRYGIYTTRQLTQYEWDDCVTADGIPFSALVFDY